MLNANKPGLIRSFQLMMIANMTMKMKRKLSLLRYEKVPRKTSSPTKKKRRKKSRRNLQM